MACSSVSQGWQSSAVTDLTSLRGDSLLGHVAVVCAAACAGASAVFARAHLQAEDRVTISAVQLAMATLLLAPVSLAVDGLPALDLSAKAWLALVTLGAVHSGFAMVIFYWLIQRVGSVRTSLVNYIIPTVGLLLGASVLGEDLGLNALLGAALIVVGVATVAGGSRRASTVRTAAVPESHSSP